MAEDLAGHAGAGRRCLLHLRPLARKSRARVPHLAAGVWGSTLMAGRPWPPGWQGMHRVARRACICTAATTQQQEEAAACWHQTARGSVARSMSCTLTLPCLLQQAAARLQSLALGMGVWT